MKTLIKLDLNKLISNKLLFLLFGLTIFSMDERITQTLSSQQFILYIFNRALLFDLSYDANFHVVNI